MTRFWKLTKRNMLLYFRDRSAVFFSLLSMLIVIVLMVLFLSDANIDQITDMLAGLPGHDTADDRDNARILVLAWTSAGILPINAVMVSLSALTSIIRDKTSGRIHAIYTAPVSRMVITLSYIMAAWICAVIVCLLTLGLSELYLCMNGMEPYSLREHLILTGMILLNGFTYSAVMYLCAALVKSEGAWSGVGTILGTLVGFLGGIYMPVGQLSDYLQDAVGCLPIIYGTVMFRKIMLAPVLDTTFADAPDAMTDGYREAMGIDYAVFGHTADIGLCISVVLAFGLLFMLLGAAATAMRRRRDR